MYFEPPRIIDWPSETAEFRRDTRGSSHLLAKRLAYPPSVPRHFPRDPAPVVVKSMPAIVDDMPMVFMKLPPGTWMYQRLEYSSPNGYNIPLTLKTNSKVELRFSSSGMRYADETVFKSVIRSAPHIVSAEERSAIGIQTFFTTAQTETINGKRVIALTGRYESDNLNVYKILFNHNPDDSDVWVDAEIVYSAPPAEYKKHIGEVKKALQTIRWAKKITYEP
ncbi:hypothetical protein KBI23_12055 [bacterium]|nr:hypothetical protein [bacterium]MBP9808647.1 hypothetical protein [bacterium]